MTNMNGNALATISALGVLLLLGIIIVAIVWLAWWMLEPINRAAGSLKAPTRFMLIDFVALMILLQIGLAICGQALSASDAGDAAARMYWVLLGVVALLALVLWSASVSAVSRAGILRPLRRIAVIVVLVPGTLTAMVGVPALLFLLIGAIAGLLRGELANIWIQRQIPWLLLGVPGLIAVIFALRRLSFWSLSGSAYATSLKNADVVQSH